MKSRQNGLHQINTARKGVRPNECEVWESLDLRVKPSFSASTVGPVYDEAVKELKLEHSMRESRAAKNQTPLSPTEFTGSRPLQIGKRPGQPSPSPEGMRAQSVQIHSMP